MIFLWDVLEDAPNVVREAPLTGWRAERSTGVYDTMSYTYTPGGQLFTVTDDAGNEWSYEYDLRGRRISADDPDTGVSTIVYDAAGQIIETTDGRGQILTHTYDDLGRKTETRDGDGTLLAEWIYDTLTDATGMLASSTSYHDGNAYTTEILGYTAAYKPQGERVIIPSAEGGLAGTYMTLRSYNENGSPDQRWLPAVAGLSSESVDHRYDAAGNLRSIGGAAAYMTDVQHTPYAEPDQFVFSALAGIEQHFDYELGTRRLSGSQFHRQGVDPADVDLTYNYDQAGNPLSVADTGGQAGAGDVQCFTYDHHRRLVVAWTQVDQQCAEDAATATIGGPAPYGQSYSYDDAGNRTRLTDLVASTTSTYDYPEPGQNGPHTLSSVTTGGAGTTSYTYDDAGNTITVDDPDPAADATYGWDEYGRLGTANVDGDQSEYVYNADGQRLIRRTSEGTTLYVHDTEITLAADGSVSAQRYYRVAGSTVAMWDSPTGIQTGAELYYLGADLWGTPTVNVNRDTLNITVRRNDPFGNPRDLTLPDWPGDLGWHTGTIDDATGLTHMGARYYQPSIGRFMSADPLMNPLDPDQIHGYAYANNSPLTYTDPNGLMPRGINWVDGVAPRSDSSTRTTITGSAQSEPKARPAVEKKPRPTCITWCDAPDYTPRDPADNPRYDPAADLAEAIGDSPGYGYVTYAPAGIKLGAASEAARKLLGLGWRAALKVSTAAGLVLSLCGDSTQAVACNSGDGTTTTTDRDDLPVLIVDADRIPTIAQHVADAQAAGHPAVLTRGDPGDIDSNRYAACVGVPPSCDEYPFVSTLEGGAGASTRTVPVREQRSQGGSLSTFYQGVNNTGEPVEPGDQFLVTVVGLD